ncbi:MAG: prepilin-type N-terminal cleavage/methylation domain-containing protein [Patescibacteria group bacterium]|nr:prepilin-type N-terminal cleavage/methylation domain-containing protein [Patescibacteria group bacterium]
MKFFFQDKKKLAKGFTLIELIVVFSVIAILSMAGLAAFVTYSRQQTINTVAQDIKTMIFNARSRASSQVSLCASGQKFGGYLVLFCPKTDACAACNVSSGYQLDIRCDGADSLVAGTTKALPAYVSVGTTSHTLLFNPISGTVSSPCDSPTSSSWNVSVSGWGKTTPAIYVNANGIIK